MMMSSGGGGGAGGGGEVVCSGWLRKSPPEKKLKRFVSMELCVPGAVRGGSGPQCPAGRVTLPEGAWLLCQGYGVCNFWFTNCWKNYKSQHAPSSGFITAGQVLQL